MIRDPPIDTQPKTIPLENPAFGAVAKQSNLKI
jgi:hypothetical protein